MSPARLCPRCGAQLPSSHESGASCPRCLFELGFEDEIVHTRGGGGAAGPEPIPIGELAPLFPQLEVLECIGQGGMGTVYRARQKGLDRDVALKLLSAEASADPAFAERFVREARALAALTHPCITSVYDFGEAGGHHYLLMEYVDGANLRQILRAGGLSPRESLAMVSQMCDALQYAHDRGIVHRDIKPENVLVDRQGRLKIADFGLAKMLAKAPVALHLTRSDQAMGTLHYMAPEQIERPLQVDHRADIFSLGVVFYELLTGELPLGRFAAPSERAKVDVRFDEVVLRALAKEPDARYQSAHDVKTDVDGLTRKPRRPKLVATPASAAAKEHDRPPRERSSVFKGVVAAAGCLVGLMLLFGCLGAFLLAGRARVTPSDAGTGATEAGPTVIQTVRPTSTEPDARAQTDGAASLRGASALPVEAVIAMLETELMGLADRQRQHPRDSDEWKRLQAEIEQRHEVLERLERESEAPASEAAPPVGVTDGAGG